MSSLLIIDYFSQLVCVMYSADADRADRRGNTALHHAALNSQVRTCYLHWNF